MTVLAPVVDGSTLTFSFNFLDENGDAINATGGSVAVVLKDLAGNTYSKAASLDADPTTVPQASVTYLASDYSGLTAPTDLYGTATLTVGTTVYAEDEFVQPVMEAQFPLANGTLATYSQAVGVFGTASDRATVERYLKVAYDFMRKETGREFISATRTEDYDGTGSEHLWLKAVPITSITSVKLLDVNGAVATTLDPTQYTYDADTGRLSLRGARDTLGRGGVDVDRYGWHGASYGDGPARGVGRAPAFPRGVKNVRVEYVGGYTAATVPADLVQLNIDIAKAGYDARAHDSNVQSETIGDYSYTLGDFAAIRERHRAALSAYRPAGVAL